MQRSTEDAHGMRSWPPDPKLVRGRRSNDMLSDSMHLSPQGLVSETIVPRSKAGAARGSWSRVGLRLVTDSAQ